MKLGKNSARWRSPAPGSTPKRSNSSSFTRQLAMRSPLVQCGADGVLVELEAVGDGPSASGSSARASASASSRAEHARGRRRRRRRARCTNGRWFTPADLQREVEEAHVEQQAQQELGDGDLVAEPDGLERGLPGEGPADRGHRVGEVQHPRVGTELLDVAGDVEEHRDVAQGAHDPAGSDGVADRLPHPWRSGISRSWRIDAKPPVEMFTTTKSASRERVAPVGGRRARVSPMHRAPPRGAPRARPCAAAARDRCRGARSRHRAQPGC